MDVAATEKDLASRNADNVSIGEQGREHLHRCVVVSAIELGDDHSIVRRIEVDVRRGQPLARDTRLSARCGSDTSGFFDRHRQRARLME